METILRTERHPSFAARSVVTCVAHEVGIGKRDEANPGFQGADVHLTAEPHYHHHEGHECILHAGGAISLSPTVVAS